MTKCPGCGQEVHLPYNTMVNVDTYGDPCISITECCGALVSVAPVRGYRVSVYNGASEVDDWGREPTKKETV